MKVQIEGMWQVGYRQSVFEFLEAMGHRCVISKPDVILIMGRQENVCLPQLLRNQRKRVVALFPEEDSGLCEQFRALGAETVVASTLELQTALDEILLE